MTRSPGRVSVAWVGTVALVAGLATATTAASAAPDDAGSTSSGEGPPEIRLEVPTSTAFDPLGQATGAAPGGQQAAGGQPAPADEPWTELTDFPTPSFDARIGLFYTMGGSDGTQVSNGMWRYRADLEDWVDDVVLPRPRQAPAIGATEWGEMVLAGGWDENGEPVTDTYYYDDGSTEWPDDLADMPSGRAAAGYASFPDGELYVIGGCTTADCDPVSDTVYRYEMWEDWSTVADYPVPVSFPSCDAWKERIYCTGGHDGTEGVSDSYVYDRRTDTWSPLPDPPTDSWGSQHGMADGVLVVNGGVQGGVLTNHTFGYDVRAGAWVDLPNSHTATYRGAGGCTRIQDERVFQSVGGLDGTDTPVALAEILPGVTGCGHEFDVPEVTRHAGDDRYGTAAAIAALYPEPQDTVYVATGEDFPDALAAAARAGSLEAPILLTPPEHLAGATRAELERLEPQDVMVIGGADSISDDVMTQIQEASGADTVERLAGSNRYETAAAIAAEVDAADTVFIATGLDFPDALTGAARAGALDAPLLLVRPDWAPGPTLDQLERLDPDQIVVLGGPASVSEAVLAQLAEHGEVERIAGADRWETAALIAAEFPAAEMVGAASGRDWADALTGAARTGGIDAPLVLVDTERVPGASWSALQDLGPSSIEVYGGTSAVSDDVVEALEALYE